MAQVLRQAISAFVALRVSGNANPVFIEQDKAATGIAIAVVRSGET